MLASGGEWMRDLLELHCEELEWLWRRRLGAWRSAEYDGRALTQLDERIAAHTDALVLAGEEALPLVHKCLEEADEAPAALGGAYALLRQEDTRVVQRALEAFQDMEGAAFEGFRLALRYAPPERHEEALKRLAIGPSEKHAAAALAALAFHGRLQSGERLFELVQSSSPEVQRAGWDIVSLLEVGPGASPWVVALVRRLAGPMQAALEEPEVRPAAMLAAAWTCQGWLLGWLRKQAAAAAEQEVLRLLAVLGSTADLPLFQALASRDRLGAGRLLVLGAFGHPEVAEVLLRTMEVGGPLAAARAAQAFQRMTGVSVETPQRVEVNLGGEADEDSGTEEVRIPDAARARSCWEQLRKALQGVTRFCWGMDVAKGGSPEWRQELPLEVRWELALRSRFESGRGEGPAVLERLAP